MSDKKLPEGLAVNEYLKDNSNYLRGTIEESLADQTTGAVADDDTQLTKFHGFYMQDDRDIRDERRKQKLEPKHTFMLRARVPGGVATMEQWLAIEKIAEDLTDYGSLRLTTRQTFQYHGILKRNLKPLIQGICAAGLDSIAACGDVNRNVMCNTNPVDSRLHAETYDWSVKISEHLLPKTRAYYEIWLDEEKIHASEEDQEPVYGKHYLPRKFKIAVAVPPHNDVDISANDLSFIAIANEEGGLEGFNVAVGGGMGSTHGDTETYPQLARILGFIKPEDTLAFAEAVMLVQRDFGNRVDRKNARTKYTVDTLGVDKFREETEKRTGIKFEAEREFEFTQQGDRMGWIKGIDNKWHLTLFIEAGRIVDKEGQPIKTGLREIAKVHKGEYRMTANQNLIIANVAEEDKAEIEGMCRKYGLLGKVLSPLMENSIACVALPTCALAMAEAERYLPRLIEKFDVLAEKHGVADQETVIRMTGCPNGCGRPFLAELGFVGKGPGKYNMYLGADGRGTRLNQMYKENIGEEEILAEVDSLFEQYSKEREENERFGDFVVRKGFVNAVYDGREFHAAN
ncbi:assimilatory sulfite reductase (NADPH) hemoprotein subunit [Catenovulum sp. SM1970]|uniref:assimilatory sulfite reductase (NADPH) hemoprotein subunit n=1 Tax=Marinifaba aquimaris TaxID=2741323 RepID=UPI001574A7C6|nr:assimilatory sulfite reductase (NADPH) hemoprotein subunit [Marinifaba aquimaris]NTS76660.1 assimilatory sulfite reductase (NADPH) hemoprotein subunit [Marinifaba aquimaris]